MGRKGLSGASNSDHRGRLKITSRADHYYLAGTLRAGKQSIRVRESTGIDRRSPGAWEKANAVRIKREADLLDAIVYGRRAPVPFAAVAADYIRTVNPGTADIRNLDDLIGAFGDDPIAEIGKARILGFYQDRFPTQMAATRRRHENTLRAVLMHGVRNDVLDAVPYWPRAVVPRAKGKAMLKRFLTGEAELLISLAAPHARPIMATQYATGQRTSAVIYLQREHFVLATGRGRVFFPETKNRHSYSRPLPDYAVQILSDWLVTRRDRRPAMFLTDKGEPYVRRRGYGGHLDAAYKAARARCVAKLIEWGMEDRARVLGHATPHWFRHNLANRLRAELGWDAKRIAEAGMWESERTVSENYIGDESAYIEDALRGLPFGKILTQPCGRKVKRRETS